MRKRNAKERQEEDNTGVHVGRHGGGVQARRPAARADGCVSGTRYLAKPVTTWHALAVDSKHVHVL